MPHKDKTKRGKIYYVWILCNADFDKRKKKGRPEALKRLLKNKGTKEKYLFVLSRKQGQNTKDIISKLKNKKSNLKKIKILPLFRANFLSEPFRKMKLLPILTIYNLQVELPLDGLAKIKPLDRLSEKTVTRKVRESLRGILDKDLLDIGCAALQENGIWIGYGSYKEEGFNWVVRNGFSITDI